MIKYKTEYRVTKKGCECFRTENFEEAKARYNELSAKRPGIYAMQSRQCRVSKVGVMDCDWYGRPAWSIWM